MPARQAGDGSIGKQQRTRRRLLGFAMELFARQGYQPTTIPEIAAAAGVSRATFFLHFPTKAALLGELSREIAELFEQEPRPDDERGVEGLERFLTFLFRETDMDAIGSALLNDFSATYGTDMAAGIGHGSLHHHAERLIAQAQAEGDWRSDWSPAAFGHFILATFNLLRIELVGLPPGEASRRLMSLIVLGASG